MKKKDQNHYSIAHAALEILGGLGEAALETFFPRNYSYTRIWRPLLGLERSKRISRRTVSTILWRLQREGLVARTGARKNAIWRLTSEGSAALQKKKMEPVETQVSDGITRLVIFDIPEYERKKRTAVRIELVACGLRKLKKISQFLLSPVKKMIMPLIPAADFLI